MELTGPTIICFASSSSQPQGLFHCLHPEDHTQVLWGRGCPLQCWAGSETKKSLLFHCMTFQLVKPKLLATISHPRSPVNKDMGSVKSYLTPAVSTCTSHLIIVIMPVIAKPGLA